MVVAGMNRQEADDGFLFLFMDRTKQGVFGVSFLPFLLLFDDDDVVVGSLDCPTKKTSKRDCWGCTNASIRSRLVWALENSCHSSKMDDDDNEEEELLPLLLLAKMTLGENDWDGGGVTRARMHRRTTALCMSIHERV